MASVTGFRGHLSVDVEGLNGCEDLPVGFWCATAVSPNDYRHVSPAYSIVTVNPSAAQARSWLADATAASKASSEADGTYVSSTPTELTTIRRVDASLDAQDKVVTPATLSITINRQVGNLIITGTSVVDASKASKASLVKAARALVRAQASRVSKLATS